MGETWAVGEPSGPRNGREIKGDGRGIGNGE